jgi:hypothetical protein
LHTNLKELLSERDYLKTLTRERNQFTHNKNLADGLDTAIDTLPIRF